MPQSSPASDVFRNFLGGYHLYLKSLVLVSRETPPISIVWAEEPKAVEFDTSTMLEKTLKTLPSHFKFKETFCFFAFYFISFYFILFYAREFGHRTASTVSKSRWISRRQRNQK